PRVCIPGFLRSSRAFIELAIRIYRGPHPRARKRAARRWVEVKSAAGAQNDAWEGLRGKIPDRLDQSGFHLSASRFASRVSINHMGLWSLAGSQHWNKRNDQHNKRKCLRHAMLPRLLMHPSPRCSTSLEHIFDISPPAVGSASICAEEKSSHLPRAIPA